MNALALTVLSECFAICRLPAETAIPRWARETGDSNELWSVTRTAEELSLVVPERFVPPADVQDVQAERDWRAVKVAGTLDFTLVGVLASLTVPLAEANISVFALSTWDTDYLLVREPDLPRAVAALRAKGFLVSVLFGA